MEFDEILEKTGPFGRYQVRVVTLLYIAALLTALPVQQDVFVSYTPEYRCQVPQCEGDLGGYCGSFLNFTIPWNDDHSEFESCSKYQLLNSSSKGGVGWSDSDLCSAKVFAENTTEGCDGQFVYSDDVFSSSTVIEFTLTCERALLTPLLGMSYMLGALVGSIVMGGLGDYIGRRLGFLLVVVLFAVGGLAGGLSQSFAMLVVTRFFTAVGGNGIFQFAFILCVENVVPRHRVPVGILINAPYALGGAIVALMSFLIRDNWRLLQCLFTVPALLLVSYYWLVPESARWLLSKGRPRKALKVLNYIAAVNGHSEDFADQITEQQDQGTTPDPELKKSVTENKSVVDLLRLPNMRGRCLINFFIWVSCTTHRCPCWCSEP